MLKKIFSGTLEKVFFLSGEMDEFSLVETMYVSYASILPVVGLDYVVDFEGVVETALAMVLVSVLIFVNIQLVVLLRERR